MNDPSDGVPQHLLPHVHLVSSYRYPILASLSVETVVDYLLQAPKVVKDVAPMNWTFLDGPSDGSVLLVWQPFKLGTHFASDGYVWADAEQAFTSDVRGYTVEMYYHRTGYRPGSEAVATHSRKRYRISLSKNSTNSPADPSLWIVHYSQAEPQNRIPVNRIPVIPQIQTLFAQRRALQSQGQLMRKEFMLHDRGSWPSINIPAGQAPGGFPQAPVYGSGSVPLGRNQQPYYPPPAQGASQPGVGASPAAKRPRHTPPTHAIGSAGGPSVSQAIIHESTIEDEEDNSRGDIFDHLTPRELSIMRYTQHHEWMEEIFSSPYSMQQIVPVDLGLGLKGELEGLTKGAFEPASSDSRGASSDDKNKIDSGTAELFTQRATERMQQLNAEMEKMKKVHARRMEKMRRGAKISEAEKRVRIAITDPTLADSEIWIPDAGLDAVKDSEGHTSPRANRKPRENAEDVIKEVQDDLGKHIGVFQDINCVQAGGLEEKYITGNDGDHEMTQDSSVNGNSREAEMQAGDSTMTGMDELPSTTSASQDAHASPRNDAANTQPVVETSGPATTETTSGVAPPAQKEATPAEKAPIAEAIPEAKPDVEMSGTAHEVTPKAGEESSDWVMVNKDAASASNAEPATANKPEQQLDAQPSDAAPADDTTGAASGDSAIPGTAPTHADDMLDTNDFGDFSNLDTAGEALAHYDENQSHDLSLGLDNSAFGDAFHGTEPHNEDEAML
ncbi:DUF1750-domain-containing protein [Xylona heveae TC161]|uniref:DUF1750-domain-containing protein n=1 Tax=Xylona heveae (strain CBS 132557 / TC161) TaxID=1328760 RepID=A0A165I567_XYLHT|nr:DUF1750-domain-containing protein [Xylona heveae TC161]KZF24401.1 DUF1750-domain-containing protein [Xylona heveae TC161]